MHSFTYVLQAIRESPIVLVGKTPSLLHVFTHASVWHGNFGFRVSQDPAQSGNSRYPRAVHSGGQQCHQLATGMQSQSMHVKELTIPKDRQRNERTLWKLPSADAHSVSFADANMFVHSGTCLCTILHLAFAFSFSFAFTFLSQLLQDRLKAKGLCCRCIRCRELRDRTVESLGPLVLMHREYRSSGGLEIFLSFESRDEKAICGFLRLRLSRLVGRLHLHNHNV